jgi:hypothetical protein
MESPDTPKIHGKMYFPLGFLGFLLDRRTSQRTSVVINVLTEVLMMASSITHSYIYSWSNRWQYARGKSIGLCFAYSTKEDAIRVVLCFLIALVTAPAWAEWVKVVDLDKATFYLDPTTIRKDGYLRRVWTVQDLKERYQTGELSRRILKEYDCKNERSRSIVLSLHAGPMVTGNLVDSTDSPSDWSAIPPQTPGSAILKIVCAK